jgi:hypothetical protein
MHDDSIDGSRRTRGPYGTNEGDIWGSFENGGPMQDRLNRSQPGLLLVHEMMDRDGTVEEGVYTTRVAELVEAAERGFERWVAAQAAKN